MALAGIGPGHEQAKIKTKARHASQDDDKSGKSKAIQERSDAFAFPKKPKFQPATMTVRSSRIAGARLAARSRLSWRFIRVKSVVKTRFLYWSERRIRPVATSVSFTAVDLT
jgi:hypothetical protein